MEVPRSLVTEEVLLTAYNGNSAGMRLPLVRHDNTTKQTSLELTKFPNTVIDTCIKGDPNTGWLNGPNAYQFYQLGFRPLNGEGAKHAPFANNDVLLSKDAFCKNRCSAAIGDFWVNWCISNCGCSTQNRKDGVLVLSCPL
jgi:hypothetical protein